MSPGRRPSNCGGTSPRSISAPAADAPAVCCTRLLDEEGEGNEPTGRIREHMQVIGADGVSVGTVDHVDGDRIKLTKKDSGLGAHEGHHHYISRGLIAAVEGDVVRLSANADVARTVRGRGRRRGPLMPARVPIGESRALLQVFVGNRCSLDIGAGLAISASVSCIVRPGDVNPTQMIAAAQSRANQRLLKTRRMTETFGDCTFAC